MNVVSLQGRLCRDLTPANKCWLASIAVRRLGKTDEVDYIPLLFQEKTGEIVSKYLHKGDGIIITGRLNSFKKGERDTRVSVVVDEFYFPIAKKRQDRPAGFATDPEDPEDLLF